MPDETPMSCFFVSPIGQEGSEVRSRADKVLKHIVRPVCEACGYRVSRADELTQSGIITVQVIQHAVNDDLVIADLTGSNPNVFYELAVRHATGRPYVQITEDEATIPFDVNQVRTISFDHTDLDSVEECKVNLERAIRDMSSEMPIVTPVTLAVGMLQLAVGANPIAETTSAIMSELQEIRQTLSNLERSSARPSWLSSRLLDQNLPWISPVSASALRNLVFVKDKDGKMKLVPKDELLTDENAENAGGGERA